MRKNLLIVFICGLLLPISTVAYSKKGVYVSGNLGMALPGNSDVTDSELPGITLEVRSDAGFACAGAIGYNFGNIRFEGEVSYQKNDLDEAKVNVLPGLDIPLTGDTSSLIFLLNGYYDFTNESPFSFFITAGAGTAKVELNDFNVQGFALLGVPNYSNDDTVFAYQAGAGVGYAINETVTFDVKYRYLGTSDPDFDTTTIEYSSHNIYAGVRITF